MCLYREDKLFLKEQPLVKILTNGRIFCGMFRDKVVWADSVAIADGKVIEVGNSNLQRMFAGQSEIIDLDGGLLLPGLGDGHLHMAVGGRSLTLPDLAFKNEEQIHASLVEYAEPIKNADRWIIAFNWETGEASITAEKLESWLPGRRVVVHQRDLHGCCASYRALKEASIEKHPELGEEHLGRDKAGKLNGLLRESAVGVLMEKIPHPDKNERVGYILAAQEYFLSLGLTSVSEVVDEGNEALYRKLDEQGKLKIQIDGWRRIENWNGEDEPSSAGNKFRCDTLKMFLDGSFGSRTAALNEPYNDKPESRGSLFYSDEDLTDLIKNAHAKNWRLAIHALGDRAVEQIYRVMLAIPRRTGRLDRIEHVQLMPENFAGKFASLGVVASIQPIHLLDDQRWIEKVIGFDRCKNCFIWRSLWDRDVPLVLGSDWPVASPDPLQNIHIAINQTGFGATPLSCFNRQEALPPEVAINAVTLGWARCANLETKRGLTAKSYVADFTLIQGVSEDLRDWSQAKISWTMCDGEILFTN